MARRWPLLVSLILSLVLALSMVFPVAGQNALDYDVANGHFYSQANGKAGEGGTGFAISDNGNVPFWSEYRRMGGPEVLGYPVSRRFMWDGFVSQAMQKVVLQWRPDQDAVMFVNVFDKLHDAGKDPWLRTVKAVPNQIQLNEQGKAWDDIVKGRLALLDSNPAIKKRYLDVKGDPITLNGLPTSKIEDFGNVYVLRAQRVVIQQWKVDVPWAKAGDVQVANGGDVGKEAGIYPEQAIVPEPAGSTGAPAVQAGAPAATATPSGSAAPAPTATPGPQVAAVPTNTPAGGTGATGSTGTSPYPRQLDPQTHMQPQYLQEVPGAQWIVVKLHQLTACENSGNGVGYLTTLNAAGAPISGVTIRTVSANTQFDYVTGEKGPGKVEGYFYRGNWDAWVLKDENGKDTTSDIAKNMNTVLFVQNEQERQALYCDGNLRNSANHFSYEVIFRKRS